MAAPTTVAPSLDFGLDGVHCLVSGASGGIGSETVACFRQLGSKVTAQFNTASKGIEGLPGVVAIQADVTSERQVDALFDQAEERNGGPVVVLIVNHGIWPTQPATLADMSLDQWRHTHAVNLDGAFLLVRRFLRGLRGQPPAVLDKASICFIGSTAGRFGEADHGDYSSTKSALMYGLVPTLKNEIVRLAPRGRVNCVAPGWVRTAMAEETLSDPNVVARALASTPLQKVALPQDVARQVAVLSSPTLSGHVTGVNLHCDGGMEGRLLFPPPH